jgi:V/A-type H+-transporting ATPase subunit K
LDLGENGETNLNFPSNKKTDRDFHNMVNITLGGQRDQMVHTRKKFSYLAITAGAVMLLMTFVTPPAFAAEGGDSALAKPILALAAAIAIAGGLIGTGSAQQGIGAAGMGIIAEKPEKFGQVLFFFVIPETLWIIGFVLGIILLLDIL